MVTLAGYDRLIPIYTNHNSRVYRALRTSDRLAVILKFLDQDYPTSEQIRRYKQEYQLTYQLDSPRIVKAYSLEQWQRSYVIVLEDFGGMSLRQWIQDHQSKPISLHEFVELAIAITESVADIHARQIIHKDINPANIIFNPETKALKLIDFGISTQLTRENPTLKNPNVLEGTLGYLSPEQTGRMNRSLDYRTDFYSLGVTFYEMLAGRLPFETDDLLELVHCHIAKVPPTPDTPYPTPILDIVMKLMAKNAQDRYQSADGLKADLEHCRRQLEKTGNIVPFPLGQQDICSRFSIPQKLYGREDEIATLLAAFERVAQTGKVELMMVAGYSGVGKSSLVQELYKPITARRGYFIAGKFDQFQRNIPYSAIVTAFGGLIRQLLGESETGLQLWRDKLLKALGSNGQIIIDTIPEVELIIGKQPPPPVLGASETQNRFNLVLGNFIGVFCDEEHPLTLFIDDLQWADLATLQLMERLLVEGKINYLLLLGAYRDNEVSAGHPLAISLDSLQQTSNAINQITLKPLPLNEIAALIGDTLQQSPKSLDLARLVLAKTGGNPFFVNEFLQALYDEELLQFDRESKRWQWELGAIAARGFTDNIVDLMVQKLQKLPESIQKILSLAACYGAEFDLSVMAFVAEKTQEEICKLLKIAIDRDLVVPLSEPDENLLIQCYKFCHDRIQQAAYALIPDEQKEITHYRIGQRLLQQIPDDAKETNIFKILGQLNYGTSLMTDQTQRDELAKLNLIACNKAKAATAYQEARQYSTIGLSMLSNDAWSSQYELTLALHELTAELAWLCSDFETMERFIQTIVERANYLLEKVNVYRINILFLMSQNKPTEAIAIAQQLLEQFGIVFGESLTQNDVEASIADIDRLIGNRDIEDLVNLPVMEDREKMAIFLLASSIIPAAYISGSLMFPLIVSLLVKLSIQYGNTPISALSYAAFGIVACNLKQDVNVAVKFGHLAMRVVSKLDAKVVKPEALQVVAGFILHRKSHVKETVPLLQETYINALEVGNPDFAGHSAVVFCLHSLWCGRSLEILEQESRAYCNGLVQLNQLTTANYCRIHWQSILNLLAGGECPSHLSGEVLDETEFLPRLLAAEDLYGLYIFYLDKLMLAYLFEDMTLARNYAVEVKRYFKAGAGSFGEPGFYFYDSLSILAALNSRSPQESSEILERVEQNQQQLQQQWANYAQHNHQHKVDLVAAEQCRVKGQRLEAMELYDRAIAGAKEHQYIQEEAIANELAAKFYLNWGRENVARVYMSEARYCYSCWGATAKVKHLEDNYPQLCQRTNYTQNVSSLNHTLQADSSQGQTFHQSNSNSSISLDLTSFMKASQSIASEMVLNQLLTQLIKIMLANTGAQSGFLILETEGDLLIEAQASAGGEIALLQSMPLECVLSDGSLPLLSSAIINYVARTYDSVVLHDASHDGNFTTQPYIQNFQVKSVLCVPLINQGQLRGLVYLENNLTTGAFTQERVEIVKLLSGQAAIAITNAKLYTEVKQKEQRLRQFLEAIPIGIAVHHATGQLHYANQTAQQLLGINIAPQAKTEELARAYQIYRGQTQELYPNEQLPIVRSLAGETVKIDDLEIHQPDRILPLEVSSTPIFDDTGKLVYGIAAFQDITERKQSEKLLIDYNQSLEKQLALSLENTQLYEASKRFVPAEFLSFLEKKSIVDVKLGDQVEREMTVLFSDIRDFTTISEQMTPEENFAFINEYLGFMEPQIQKHDGFIDKYIGDAIMALFPNSADDAVKGSLAMLEELKTYNSYRQQKNLNPLRIGIGLHTGKLILGTVGGFGRMDGTAIGDAVNLSSRVEGLTKNYGVSLLITHQTLIDLNNPLDYQFRFIEKVRAKGKAKAVSLFEVFSADPPELKEAKSAMKEPFERAVVLYYQKFFEKAARLFEECLEFTSGGDCAARSYLARCHLQLS